ncbi:hypothetical protein Hdeb2414_s0021g00577851 [Helianthus debilis subsp. tardiflorus]
MSCQLTRAGTGTEFTEPVTFSVPTFDIFVAGSVPVFTLKYRYRYQIVPCRVYSVPVPTFADFRYRYFQFRYRSVPSSSLFTINSSCTNWKKPHDIKKSAEPK